MIPVLGIPHYNRPELTARCIQSIDYSVDRLVLVINHDACPPEEAQSLNLLLATARTSPLIKRVHVCRHVNAGVSGAWNEIIKLFPAPWWFLVNNDIQFSPGDLQKVSAHFAAALADPFSNLACAYANHGASAFGVTATGIYRVGTFDENIFPAYLEDCDWARRCDLLDLKREDVSGCAMIHGDAKEANDQSRGSCTVNATPALAQNSARTHGGNFEYYRAKWGGENGREKFRIPFNDPAWPVWAWRFEPARRSKQQWT